MSILHSKFVQMTVTIFDTTLVLKSARSFPGRATLTTFAALRGSYCPRPYETAELSWK